MRFEDRELAGPAAEREVETERASELERKDEHELPAVEPLQVLDDRSEHRVIDAMRAILDHRQLVVNDLALPKRELDALEALKAAVDARDGTLSRFVYASDRRELLEQALAVLQPKIAAQTAMFPELVQRVGELRHDLKGLEDAEDELLVTEREVEQAAAAAEPADEDQSLDGPERVLPKPPSSLAGPDVAAAPAKLTLVDGPAVPDRASEPTTLTGPEVVETSMPSTLFDGTAAPEPASAPTTLGEAKEIAAAEAKRPWWKWGRTS